METSEVGQLLLVGVPGPELDAETATILRRVQPGGFILFTRNIVSPVQLRKLIDDLRDLSRREPIVTIDQEGGRVSRLKAIGNEPPSASQLRERNDETLVRRHGELTARMLRLFGFNLDLAPVIDLCLNGDETKDNSLRGRCYGVDVPQVIRLAGVFSEALRQEITGRFVRSSLIEPGATESELVNHVREDVRNQLPPAMGQMLRAADIADAILYIVTRPRHVAVNEILVRPTEQVR